MQNISTATALPQADPTGMLESKLSEENLRQGQSPPAITAKRTLGLIRSASGKRLSEIAKILHTHTDLNQEFQNLRIRGVKRVDNDKIYGAYSTQGELMGFVCGTKLGKLGFLGSVHQSNKLAILQLILMVLVDVCVSRTIGRCFQIPRQRRFDTVSCPDGELAVERR